MNHSWEPCLMPFADCKVMKPRTHPLHVTEFITTLAPPFHKEMGVIYMKRQMLLLTNSFSVLHEANRIPLSCENLCHVAGVSVRVEESPHLKGDKRTLTWATEAWLRPGVTSQIAPNNIFQCGNNYMSFWRVTNRSTSQTHGWDIIKLMGTSVICFIYWCT